MRYTNERNRLIAAVTLSALLVLGGAMGGLQPAGATTGDIGTPGPSTSGAAYPATSDKPQSKLWYAQGQWWGCLFDTGSQTWRIFRLDRPTATWVNTGVLVDERVDTLADTLWDGTHLYIASHVVSVSTDHSVDPSRSGSPARLMRYSLDPVSGSYQLDAGFPAVITDNSSESMTLDKDSTGVLWATWTQVSGSATTGWTNKVYVNATNGTDSGWRTPFVLPVKGSSPAPDDISAVVAYGKSRIGVMWSNQNDGTVYWAVHRDGTRADQWTAGPAVRSTAYPDDHMNLKSVQADTTGRVVAAVKTSFDTVSPWDPNASQIELLVFRPATGAWTRTQVGTLADCHTRPVVLLDEEHARVHVLATAPSSGGCPYSGAAGTIYDKTASLDNPVFSAGRGTPVIRDAASADMNNATSTKQSVSSATGLVVLASNTTTSRYWFADLPLTSALPSPSPTASGSPTPTPTASATPTPTPTPTPTATATSSTCLDASLVAGNQLTVNAQSMETSVTPWTTLNAGGTVADTATCYDGAHAAQVTATTGGTVTVFKASRVSGSGGTAYTFTSWLWTGSAGRTGDARLDFYNGSGTWISGAIGAPTGLTVGGWTQVVVRGTSPTGTATVLPILDYTAAASGEPFVFDRNVLTIG